MSTPSTPSAERPQSALKENQAAKAPSRFELKAIAFVEKCITPYTTYFTTLVEDTSNGSSDPSSRVFKVTFSKPNYDSPVSAAVVKLYISMKFENKKYSILGYKLEGKKQLLEETFPFQEVWVDRIVRQKLRMRNGFGFRPEDIRDKSVYGVQVVKEEVSSP